MTATSCAHLMKQIAALDIQILDLESHLLSLYRNAFPISDTNHHSRSLPPHVQPHSHRSLAHHFGTPHTLHALNHPATLSQHILRCICSIYSKFASSTTNVSATWSPQSCNQLLRDCTSPYAATIQVTRIRLDDHTFKYAATMLQKFRSLVESLEFVDPGKMKREQKLAFWLNIHNALVMHGYLAYGTHNFAKNASILKAAYNVGGHCINAHVIQTSILGIRSHYSAPWIHTLLSPNKKKKTTKHIYCLEYPEPLVHFALCSGSCSDPLVRVYTPNNVFQDLKLARDEFIRATLDIHKESKLFLPKLVYHYGREMSMSMNELLETVCSCVAEAQQKTMRACITGRHEKCVSWIPISSTFQVLMSSNAQLIQT